MPWVVYVSDTGIPAMAVFSSESYAEAQARGDRVRESASRQRRYGIRVEVRWEENGGVSADEDTLCG
jgi:hypothetical protein